MLKAKFVNVRRVLVALTVLFCGLMLAGTASFAAPAMGASNNNNNYVIGAGDNLQIFVWQNKDLSTAVPVRPDGQISIPLVEDMQAAGKTPTELARDIETRLKKFVNDPVVTVMVSSFVGAYSQQIRVVGEAAQPQALPYRQNMSVLDAMIAVGGLTPYAAGNRAKLVRTVNGQQTTRSLNLSDLLKDGDMSANMPLQPGDIIIIPESYF
jgi:polysaccharide export outer membrane protein